MFRNAILFTLFISFTFSLVFCQPILMGFDKVANIYTIEKISDPSEGVRVLITNNKLEGQPVPFNFGLESLSLHLFLKLLQR